MYKKFIGALLKTLIFSVLQMRHPTLDFKYAILANSAYETLFEMGESDKLKKMNQFITDNNFTFQTVDEGVSLVMQG